MGCLGSRCDESEIVLFAGGNHRRHPAVCNVFRLCGLCPWIVGGAVARRRQSGCPRRGTALPTVQGHKPQSRKTFHTAGSRRRLPPPKKKNSDSSQNRKRGGEGKKV